MGWDLSYVSTKGQYITLFFVHSILQAWARTEAAKLYHSIGNIGGGSFLAAELEQREHLTILKPGEVSWGTQEE